MKKQGYQIVDQHAPHFLTFTVTYWIDAFTHPIYKKVLIDSLAFYQKSRGLQIHAYVIMTNHMHLIASTPNHRLSDWIRDYKKWTSQEIRKLIKTEPESRRKWMSNLFQWRGERNSRNADFQFWIQHNQPKLILYPSFAQQKIEYIHQNPVKAQIVYQAENYVWSSAQDYAGIKGPLDVNVWEYWKYDR